MQLFEEYGTKLLASPELTWELSNFVAKDPDTYETYKNKVIDFLVRGMKEKM